jgi:two-component system sensor kinase FixL
MVVTMRADDGAGACAEQIRRLDWATTPLGPTHAWPQFLQCVVAMMLRSSAPKLLLWGGDFITFYNDAHMRLMQGIGPEGIGRPYPVFRPTVWQHMEGFVDDVLHGASGMQSQLIVEPPLVEEGKNALYQLCYMPVPDEAGVPGGVLVDVFDATPARGMEVALRLENERLNRLFAEAPVFIAHGVGPELRIEFFNRAFRQMLEGREIQGRPALEVIPELAGHGLVEALQDVYRTGLPWMGSDVRLSLMNRKTGSEEVHYLDFVYQPVRDDHGNVSGILCAGSDVTERHMAQVEAERLRHQLLHASRINAMGTMAMTLAHELNQPLAAAGNYVSAARHLIAKDQENADSVLEAAQEEIARAADVIRRTRSVVRSGRAERTCVSFRRVFDRALSLLDVTGPYKIEVTVRLDEAATHVLADEIQLEQVILNLIKNSMEASAESERREVIITSRRTTDNKVLLQVRDFGLGLQQEILESLFDLVGLSTRDGLGVGLSLTRTIIEANGGQITAANAVGGGAVFSIELDAPLNA